MKQSDYIYDYPTKSKKQSRNLKKKSVTKNFGEIKMKKYG